MCNTGYEELLANDRRMTDNFLISNGLVAKPGIRLTNSLLLMSARADRLLQEYYDVHSLPNVVEISLLARITRSSEDAVNSWCKFLVLVSTHRLTECRLVGCQRLLRRRSRLLKGLTMTSSRCGRALRGQECFAWYRRSLRKPVWPAAIEEELGN